MSCTLAVSHHTSSGVCRVFEGPIIEEQCNSIKSWPYNHATITKMLTMPVRTPDATTWKDAKTWKTFAFDLFFPLTSNIDFIQREATKIKVSFITTTTTTTPLINASLAIKRLIKVALITIDLLTLAIRLMTCIPRIYFNSIKPAHPAKTFLVSKNVDPATISLLNRIHIYIKNSAPTATHQTHQIIGKYIYLTEQPLDTIVL